MGKTVLRVLAGEAVWPPPVWLMRQAGRYLPEYRAIRAQAGDFVTLCTTPHLAAEVTLQPLRRFGMDAAILFSDILLIPWALGQPLRFAEGEGPLLEPIRDAAGLAALRPNGLLDRLAPVLETVARVRAEVGEATLIGFAGAPWTVACYMVEGAGSKEFAVVRTLAYREPSLFAALIDCLVEATTAFLCAQIDAGAETVMLFDSWAGLLPPSGFHTHVIEPTASIVRRVRGRYPIVPIIGFPRLAGTRVAEYVALTGVDAVGIDTQADAAHWSAALGRTPVQGNLDPIALLAGGPAQRTATETVLDAARGRPWIFNLGHGILPATPPEHVADLLATVRAA